MLHTQLITLDLDGITPEDYLAHFVDPDPPIEASRLVSVAVESRPQSEMVVAVLRWDGTPPPAHAAASAAGLQLTQDVVDIRSRVEVPRRRAARRQRRPLALAAAI
jgi:hypothetical protein